MRKILSLLTAILFAGSMMATDVAVTIHASSGDYYAKTHSWQNGTKYDQVELDENITANCIGTGNNGKYYQDWRFYTNGSNTGSFSIDAAEGYELQSVTFTYATQNNGALYMGETQLTSQTAVAVSGQKAVFQCKNTNDATNGQVRLTAISVTYGAAAPAPSHTYTVAGGSDVLFGTTWAPANTANDMALVEGLYTWEKSELTLAAGNIEFKVCEDHAWTNCWPSENYQLNIPEAGIYTITITYNPSDNAVNAVATKTGSAVVVPTVAMHGNFTGTWVDSENFAVAEGNATASLTLNLAAGNYEFGMRIGGSGNWTANGVHFTRENNSAAVVAGQGNLTLAADAAGEYTFTWTYETNTLAITFPEAGPVEPTAKFYITGNAALVGQDKEWNPAAVASMADTLELNLEANVDYILKVTLNGTWEGENNVKGYNELTEVADGLKDISNDHNIGFKLAEAGVVKVVYIAAANEQPEVFKLIGNFYVEPVEPTAKFYVTGNAALVGQDKEWNPAAVASMADTLELNLEANVDYILKVTLNGTWEGENNVKGYNELTEVADGLKDISNDHNIGFKLAEAGVVKVVYIAAANEQPEVFKLIGNFYVEPVEPTAKFYITGNAALVGQDKEWNPAAIESMDDSKVLALEAGSYMMKITLNGTWEGENNVKGYDALTGEIPAGVTRGEGNDNDNICFTLAEAGDVTVTYTGEIFTIAGNFYVAPIEPTAKFYVVGNEVFAGADAWNPTAIPSMTDTLVHMAGQGINVLRLSLNGTWDADQQRDFRNLTEVADGLSEDIDEYQNHNIKFVLEEAGEVKIIYNETTFKLEGNFYVEPVEPTAKFYVTGNAALVGQDKEWNPAAVASMADTLELNLEANVDYILKVTLNGTWEGENNVKGYNELTEVADGLKDISNDHNIGFKLAEAGVVKVVYIAAANEQPEVFKLIGDFYVAPPADPTVAVIGDMTEWEAQLPFELSEDKTYATLSNDNIKKGTYAFKLIVNGEWRSNGYEYHREFPGAAGITGNVEANMTVNIDVEGAYTFVWTFANDSFAIVYPEKPEPQLANGYYLVGSMNDWTPAAEYFLEQNPDNEAEYELDINLNVNDEIKVVYVENDAIVTWYPKEGDNYVIDDHHNGVTTLYFRPDYLGGDDWFAGCIYVVPTSTVGFDNVDADAKAIKQVINGKLFILRGDKTYTVDGQIVR